MATKWMALCFMMALLLHHADGQHWSYGLNPGGKRHLDGLTDTSLQQLVDSFPRGEDESDASCSVLDCESLLDKLYRTKTFLGGGRENAHRTF